MKRGVAVRIAAADLLHRVLVEGAYSNIVARTGTRDLDDRDRRRCQRLLYSTIRMLPRVDAVIAAYSTRSDIDETVLDTLRVAVAELLFLDGDAYAVVDGAVEAIRERGMPRAAGFVNGVLRSVARGGEPALPTGAGGDALRLGAPPWLYERLSEFWDPTEAVAFLEASNREAAIGLRERPGGRAPGEPFPGIDGSYLSSDAAAVGEAVASGDAAVVDPASTAVGLAVAARRGDRVVDLAAAPGGKTLHLWDQTGGADGLYAGDRHRRRVVSARRRLDRIGVRIPWVVADAADPPFRAGSFDRVLLDAPCTGLGTLRRRPEIKLKLRRSSPAEAGRDQRRMLEGALQLVRSGGRLVYSVCTVFPEETIDVVAGLGASSPADVPGRPWGDGLLLAPHLTATDGMFIAVIEP
jgi:16S rRNA (cytosine967-C5)-methyltransferase